MHHSLPPGPVPDLPRQPQALLGADPTLPPRSHGQCLSLLTHTHLRTPSLGLCVSLRNRSLCLTRIRCGVQCQQVKAGIVPHPQQHGAQGLPVQPNWAAHIPELPDGVPKVRAAVRHATYHVPRCAGPDGVWVCVQLGHGPPAAAAPRSGSAMADMQGQMQQMMMQLQMQSCMQQLQSPRVQTPGMGAAARPQMI